MKSILSYLILMFIMQIIIYNILQFIQKASHYGSNWGFIKNNNKYKLAPIFDNGSCLYPQMIDENIMYEIMNSEQETNKRIYEFPTS